MIIWAMPCVGNTQSQKGVKVETGSPRRVWLLGHREAGSGTWLGLEWALLRLVSPRGRWAETGSRTRGACGHSRGLGALELECASVSGRT